eukprot:1912917-Prymnesium_polylepis.1
MVFGSEAKAHVDANADARVRRQRGDDLALLEEPIAVDVDLLERVCHHLPLVGSKSCSLSFLDRIVDRDCFGNQRVLVAS